MKRANVPQFPGLNVETLLAHFIDITPVTQYLPDEKPVLKVPRGFVFDVTLVSKLEA